MKVKSGTLISVDLKIQINITEEGGIVLLGILSPTPYYVIDDREISINEVFFILADKQERI
jgi:hypothetical protein